jgi:hypothetical protein
VGKLKEWFKEFKEELSFQKEMSKGILKDKWDIGAEQGKKMKEKQKEFLRRKKKDG